MTSTTTSSVARPNAKSSFRIELPPELRPNGTRRSMEVFGRSSSDLSEVTCPNQPYYLTNAPQAPNVCQKVELVVRQGCGALVNPVCGGALYRKEIAVSR